MPICSTSSRSPKQASATTRTVMMISQKILLTSKPRFICVQSCMVLIIRRAGAAGTRNQSFRFYQVANSRWHRTVGFHEPVLAPAHAGYLLNCLSDPAGNVMLEQNNGVSSLCLVSQVKPCWGAHHGDSLLTHSCDATCDH